MLCCHVASSTWGKHALLKLRRNVDMAAIQARPGGQIVWELQPTVQSEQLQRFVLRCGGVAAGNLSPSARLCSRCIEPVLFQPPYDVTAAVDMTYAHHVM